MCAGRTVDATSRLHLEVMLPPLGCPPSNSEAFFWKLMTLEQSFSTAAEAWRTHGSGSPLAATSSAFYPAHFHHPDGGFGCRRITHRHRRSEDKKCTRRLRVWHRVSRCRRGFTQTSCSLLPVETINVPSVFQDLLAWYRCCRGPRVRRCGRI